MAHCSNCGAELEGGVAFCASCGAEVDDSDPTPGAQDANDPTGGLGGDADAKSGTDDTATPNAGLPDHESADAGTSAGEPDGPPTPDPEPAEQSTGAPGPNGQSDPGPRNQSNPDPGPQNQPNPDPGRQNQPQSNPGRQTQPNPNPGPRNQSNPDAAPRNQPQSNPGPGNQPNANPGPRNQPNPNAGPQNPNEPSSWTGNAGGQNPPAGGRAPGQPAQQRATGHDTIPFGLGFVAGVVAFAIGYGVTWVQKSGQASDSLGQLSSLGSAPETWQAVGWVFMAMHNVTLEATRSGARQSASQAFGANAVQEQWLLVVPVAALVFAGYYVAKSTNLRQNSGVKAGATVVTGYFVCAIALAFLSTWTLSTTVFGQSISVSVGPKLTEAAALAGIGYPLVLGAVGGALADL